MAHWYEKPLRTYTAEQISAVEHILRDWNPIGAYVPPDEYDDFAPVFLNLLNESASEERLVKRMREIAEDFMGLNDFSSAHAHTHAIRLIDFWQRQPGG